MAVADCVAVNLQSVLAILEVIRNRRRLRRQLVRFAHWHKACAEVICKRRRENKSARFDTHDGIDFHPFVFRSERIDRLAQAGGMFQKRRNVVKINAWLGKVRHFAN